MQVGKTGFLKRNTKMHKVDLDLVVHPVGPLGHICLAHPFQLL